MKKLYIKPKSKFHRVRATGDYLQYDTHAVNASKVRQLDMLGKDRGDYDDEDYEDVW